MFPLEAAAPHWNNNVVIIREAAGTSVRKRKPKEKPAFGAQAQDAKVDQPVARGPEPLGPAVRKRKRRPLRVSVETVTAMSSQKALGSSLVALLAERPLRLDSRGTSMRASGADRSRWSRVSPGLIG
ncbi:hypothetical protein EYF80_032276 [Liparis tanakae]|uniref:Uncharacterized protein n=1 Tax=Liparis tanakae TaxID=230148 RepID=A0A4Z2GXR3_9TELE|nr:hypothetical protein EYF80_032276 [Liparis tanakae]